MMQLLSKSDDSSLMTPSLRSKLNKSTNFVIFRAICICNELIEENVMHRKLIFSKFNLLAMA